MVQLRTQRTALILYGVLLVLPTLVLGGLQWRQIVLDRQTELAAVPQAAEDAALRFENATRAEFNKLLLAEDERPFQQYANLLYLGAPDLDASDPRLPPQRPLASPLLTLRRPHGLLAWFTLDLREALYGDEPEVQFFWGEGAQERVRFENGARQATRQLVRQTVTDGPLRRAGRLGEFDEFDYPLRDLVASQAHPDDEECLLAERELLNSSEVKVLKSRMHVELFRSEDGEPRLVATRRLLVDPLAYLRGLTPCIDRVRRGLGLLQGFFIDPYWLFEELPREVAGNVLGPSQRFVGPSEACCDDGSELHAAIPLFEALGIEVRASDAARLGTFHIAVDTGQIQERFRARMSRFLGVAAMLAISLATGLVLLLRSVRLDLRQAERAENFVAAVTHELRTPLASIKLHGEMLLDGWAPDEERRHEYYRRIVRETERLATLVERVLEKARLSGGAARPYPADLNAQIEALRPALLEAAGANGASGASESPEGTQTTGVHGAAALGSDLAFDLAADLPWVLCTPEAVTSILVNLVENARKYAPVDARQTGAEPIRIATRAAEGGVLLEVLDRGPGVPASERRRVFEAFYRVGNEATRTTRGTGLGLHLVALQAQSLGASARVDERPGGGAAFRVRFESAGAVTPAPRAS